MATAKWMHFNLLRFNLYMTLSTALNLRQFRQKLFQDVSEHLSCGSLAVSTNRSHYICLLWITSECALIHLNTFLLLGGNRNPWHLRRDSLAFGPAK